MNTTSSHIKKIVTLGMLCAFAFVVHLVTKIPVNFLTCDAKDAVITIGGFLFGPLEAALISIVVSFVEMLTTSSTGIIGCVMNILSTAAFACPAAFVYKKKRTLGGAIAGLAAGVVFSTVVMLLWNYLLTPLYMNTPREVVVSMMLPLFLPFNLLKGGLNAALTLLFYKPLAKALQQAGLLPGTHSQNRHRTLGVSLVALVLLATFVFILLVWNGKI